MKPIQVTSVINVLLPEEISLATCCYCLSSSKKRECYFAFEFLFCCHYSKREKQEKVDIIICCNKRNALIGSAIFHVDYQPISFVLWKARLSTKKNDENWRTNRSGTLTQKRTDFCQFLFWVIWSPRYVSPSTGRY